ncbi:hypothetical protein Vretimale_16832 [Volvox reticuliferus]|uniref:Uncharacterized protein n=1 Tax=Volvox reticuliferus TaxID=1737510 RepID=A0A8J4LXS7_9CHLO|nr:hypothetical protein Vretifemale_18517 [Volvox reticuliferus]GIM13765.1 hypothetical protein Vretimale_16832 [Volvox reticuliferus]
MGKNQAHKAMQRSRYAGGGGSEEGGTPAFNDGLKDVTFHTAEWHAARIASLQVERMPWEEWRQKQKEAEGKLAAAAEEEERLMRPSWTRTAVSCWPGVATMRTWPRS